MKNIGIVSYNINCNFTNYGSALQSWALNTVVGRMGYRPVLVDYCPDVLKEADPLNPFKKMWDKDEESRRMCELTMPAIRENYAKFEKFYTERFNRTAKKYTPANFNDIVADEKLDGFVCGSDTIFCVDEFGIDDGYYANYPCMKGNAVAYAASFGDSHFTDETYKLLNERLQNFKAIGLRENQWVPYVRNQVEVPVEKVLDPTLLLRREDYDQLAISPKKSEPYLLLYARRYNPKMEQYAINLAKREGLKVVEISLRATNAEKGHEMRYDAGVEEFLGLVRDAEFVVTNSFHGMIMAVHYQRPFVVFSREQCDRKIDEVLALFGLGDRLMVTGDEGIESVIDYLGVQKRVENARMESVEFLRRGLHLLEKGDGCE